MGYVAGFELDARHAIYIYQGSLVDVAADALVSSDDNYLSAGGGVSRALSRAAGRDVQLERKRLAAEARPRTGDVVRTAAGALPCKWLYHAITIDYDATPPAAIGDDDLRRLVSNLIARAEEDGVRSIGMPAIGTGAAQFDLERASEIVVTELIDQLLASKVERIVLALLGNRAQELFYERLIGTQEIRVATQDLRRRDHTNAAPTPELRPTPSIEVSGVVQQFSSLTDEARLAEAGAGRPRLVAGLASVILQHADPAEVEAEILAGPMCHRFRGTIEQRLMEFLYLGETQLRTALGPALFRTRDLREIAAMLDLDVTMARDHGQFVDTILRGLCFNLVTPPLGIETYVASAEALLGDIERAPVEDQRALAALGGEVGKLLEQVLVDLVRLYAAALLGSDHEAELVTRQLVPPRRDGAAPLSRLTIGQLLEALQRLQKASTREPALASRLQAIGRAGKSLIPDLDLRPLVALRNSVAHHRPGGTPQADVHSGAAHLRAFLTACRAGGHYPDVLRYEGTYEVPVHLLTTSDGAGRPRSAA